LLSSDESEEATGIVAGPVSPTVNEASSLNAGSVARTVDVTAVSGGRSHFVDQQAVL
jgi:hypothetical protein